MTGKDWPDCLQQLLLVLHTGAQVIGPVAVIGSYLPLSNLPLCLLPQIFIYIRMARDIDQIKIDTDNKRHPDTLSGKELYWLKHGDAPPDSSYRKSDLEAKVANKIKSYNKLVQTLINEAYILDTNGYIEENEHIDREEIWNNTVQIEPAFSEKSSRGLVSPDHRKNEDMLVGYELSRSLYTLHPKSRTESWEDFLWGFIIGAVDRDELSSTEELENQLYLLEHFKRNNRIRYNLEGRGEITKDFLLTLQPDVNIVEESLINSDIRPSQPVIRYIMRAFRGESIELSEDNVISYIQQLTSKTDLEEVDHLQKMIDMDIDVVRNKNNSGPDAVKILKKLSDRDRASKQIAEAFNQGTGANLVGTVLNDFSKVDADREGGQPYYAITQKKSNDQWTLTNYGEVLCYQLFERDFSDGWIYRYAITPELLSDHEYDIIDKSLEEIKD